jgi:hypothetical protein
MACGRRNRVGSARPPYQPLGGAAVNTRTIAIIALVIAVIVVLLLIL